MELAEVDEQRQAALRRVAAADERLGEWTAHSDALGEREASRAAELATLTVDLARERREHSARMTELTAKLDAEQGLAERNRDDGRRLHAELLEATAREQQVAKELLVARQQLDQLESALRQRQEETEQTHKALGAARDVEIELRQKLAAVGDREAALDEKLGLAEEELIRLSAQHYAALADARGARSHVDRLALALRQAREEAEIELGEMQKRIDAARAEALAEAQLAETKLIAAERTASERSEEIAQLSVVVSERERHNSELEAGLARTRSEVFKLHSQQAELAQTLADRQLELDEQQLILEQRQSEVEQEQASAEWLRQVHVTLSASPWWWRLLPPSARRRRESRILLSRGLFDEQNYLARYPDVAGLNPLRHYILHGLSEGRRF